MESRDYIVGIDIGSSNVVMAVGVRNDNGTVSVVGVEVQEIEGYVKDGEIVNYIELGNAIAKAKAALESELGRRLNSAYVGISGRSIYCVRYEDYVNISNKTGCVTENELRELHSRIEMVVSGGGDVIVDRIPLRYRINDNQEVTNPIGAYGRKLSATYLFVLTGKQQEDFVNRALYRAEMKVCGLCVNPTLLPQVLLSAAEREDGAMIVDIGAELTDISIVREGKLWDFSSLPIGASSINDDLQEFLRTSKRNVDPLKRKYGSAIASLVPDDVTVPVKTAGNARKQILQRNIAEIAEERLKDIAGFVMRQLKASKFLSKIPCGVVLTGGSAYLENIDKLFARELDMEVRLGTMVNGIDDESQQMISAFPQSVVMALLCYGANHNACETVPTIKSDNAVNVEVPVADRPTHDIFTKPEVVENDNVVNTPVATPIVEKVAEDVLEEPIEKPIEAQHDEPIVKPQEEVASPASKEKKRGGWLTRFRNWVDDALSTDEYL